jgi:hypothetical protein
VRRRVSPQGQTTAGRWVPARPSPPECLIESPTGKWNAPVLGSCHARIWGSKVLRWRLIPTVTSLVVAGAVSTFGFTPAARATGVAHTPPSIIFFKATPSSLSSAGGPVSLSADVANATSCTFTSKRPVVGLPATFPCSNGVINENVTVTANSSPKVLIYRFKLAVAGSRTLRQKVQLTLASGNHILQGSQWTLVEHPPFSPARCSVQTFVSRHKWIDDSGHKGTFTGGGPTIQEPAHIRQLFVLFATWSDAANEYAGSEGDASNFYSITLSPGPTPGC